jgi:hypothetical protein
MHTLIDYTAWKQELPADEECVSYFEEDLLWDVVRPKYKSVPRPDTNERMHLEFLSDFVTGMYMFRDRLKGAQRKAFRKQLESSLATKRYGQWLEKKGNKLRKITMISVYQSARILAMEQKSELRPQLETIVDGLRLDPDRYPSMGFDEKCALARQYDDIVIELLTAITKAQCRQAERAKVAVPATPGQGERYIQQYA